MKANGILKCQLVGYENNHAILDFGTYGKLTVARKYLPNQAKIGSDLNVELISNESLAKRRENLAKAILEEILNGK